MTKKYEITSIKSPFFASLHQIRALVTIPHVVNAGELGGYIENESNLSQEGDCWVYDNACVVGDARVYGNARVCMGIAGNPRVLCDAFIQGNAQVYDNACISCNVLISDSARVCGNSRLFDAEGEDAIMIFGETLIYGDMILTGDVTIDSSEDIHYESGLTIYRDSGNNLVINGRTPENEQEYLIAMLKYA